jgi:CelD/BcsL family acetyltransferase involved in cellulose biosynthesis
LLARRGSEFRKAVKRWRRRVGELGDARLERSRPPLEASVLEEIIDVERSSWKWEQGNSSFSPGSKREFLLNLLRDDRADVTVWLMRLSDRLVAYALVLTLRDRWYYYLSTFRKEIGNAGSFLLAAIAEAACKEGCIVLNLLRGNQPYKRTWTDHRDIVHEILWPVNLRGQLASVAYLMRWRAAQNESLIRLRARLFRVGDRRSTASDG